MVKERRTEAKQAEEAQWDKDGYSDRFREKETGDRRTKEREEERERKREGNARVARGLAKETKVSRSLAVDG